MPNRPFFQQFISHYIILYCLYLHRLCWQVHSAIHCNFHRVLVVKTGSVPKLSLQCCFCYAALCCLHVHVRILLQPVNMAVKINMCCLHATDLLTENTITQTHYTEIFLWITFKRPRENWKTEREKRWKKLGGLQSMDSLDSKGRERGWGGGEKEMWRYSSKTKQGAERKSYFSKKASIMHALPHSGAQEDGKE